MPQHKIQVKLWTAPTTVTLWVEDDEVDLLVPLVERKVPGKFEYMEIAKASGGPLDALVGSTICANNEALLKALSLRTSTDYSAENLNLDEVDFTSSGRLPHAQPRPSRSKTLFSLDNASYKDTCRQIDPNEVPLSGSRIDSSTIPFPESEVTRIEQHEKKKERRTRIQKAQQADPRNSVKGGMYSRKFKKQVERHGVAQAMHLLDVRIKKARLTKMKQAEVKRWNVQDSGMEVETNHEDKLKMLNDALEKL